MDAWIEREISSQLDGGLIDELVDGWMKRVHEGIDEWDGDGCLTEGRGR
jgi:hypothetical protein